MTNGRDGDTFQFTASLADGTSATVKLTVSVDDTAKKSYLVAEDGTKYDVAAYTTAVGATTVTANELDNAFTKELSKTDLGKSYNITAASNKITMEAKEEGTAVSKVVAFDYEKNINGTASGIANSMSVVVVNTALDEGREIDAADINKFDGTNLDDAIFTINGHKFVLLSENLTGKDQDSADTGTNHVGGDLDVKAGMSIPSDVHVLIGGRGGLKANITNGANSGNPGVSTNPGTAMGDDHDNAANGNFAQNIKLISEVTGECDGFHEGKC